LDARLMTLLLKKNTVENSKGIKTTGSNSQPGKINMDLIIGSWNVLSLYRPRTLKMLLDQLELYLRWDGMGNDVKALGERKWKSPSRNS
jgi:hypothetical protein